MRKTQRLELLTLEEAAQILCVKKSWIYGRICSGDLPFRYVKVGRYLRFKLQDLEKYIASVTQEVSDP